MKIGLKQTVQALDLASALEGDTGTFVCQQGGQSHLVVAAAGHSIKLGPIPFGRRYNEFPFSTPGQAEPWNITKISNEDVSEGFETDIVTSRAAR